MKKEEIEDIKFYQLAIKNREDDLKRLKAKLKKILNVCDHIYPDNTDAIDFGTCKICETHGLYYKDERFCEHCNKDTMHECLDSTHERDSSQDYQECLDCNWYSVGGSEYHDSR